MRERGTWYVVQYMVCGTWYVVHGMWYMVCGTWYVVHGISGLLGMSGMSLDDELNLMGIIDNACLVTDGMLSD